MPMFANMDRVSGLAAADFDAAFAGVFARSAAGGTPWATDRARVSKGPDRKRTGTISSPRRRISGAGWTLSSSAWPDGKDAAPRTERHDRLIYEKALIRFYLTNTGI
jgi:hypothetical protein